MKRAAQQSVTTNRLRAGVRNSLIIGVGLLVAACQSQSQSSSSSSMPSPSSPSSASSSSPSNPSPPSSSSSSSSSSSARRCRHRRNLLHHLLGRLRSRTRCPLHLARRAPRHRHLVRPLVRPQAHRRVPECLLARAATQGRPAQPQARNQPPDSRAVCLASAWACQVVTVYRVPMARAQALTRQQARQEEIVRPAILEARVDNQVQFLRY